MPTVCIQCALEAFVTNKGLMPSAAIVFDETPEDHARRVHPDPVATNARRRWLEAEAAKLLPRDR